MNTPTVPSTHASIRGGDQQQQAASSSSMSSSSLSSSSRRRHKKSSSSSSAGSRSKKAKNDARRSATTLNNSTDTTTCHYTSQYYHNPLLLIILALLIAICPSPWMLVMSSWSSSAAASAATADELIIPSSSSTSSTTTNNGRKNPIPDMLNGLFDNVKNAWKKEKEEETTTKPTLLASTPTDEEVAESTETAATTLTTSEEDDGKVKSSGSDEEGEKKEKNDETSQVCISSPNQHSDENCRPEELGEASEPEESLPTGGNTDAPETEAAIEAATEIADVKTDTVTTGYEATTTTTTTAAADKVTTENKVMASGDTIVASIDADYSSAAATTTPFTCQDIDDGCQAWTQSGTSTEVCIRNSAYMTHHCPVSCNTCDVVNFGYRMITTKRLEGGLAIIPLCQDNHYDCKAYADNGECTKNPEYMHVVCEASCRKCAEESNEFGVGQRLEPENKEDYQLVTDWLKNTVEYMHTIQRDERYARVIDDCLNLVPDCTFWAAKGECDKNPDYMTFYCGPACMTCDDLF